MKKSYKFLSLAIILGGASALTSCGDYLEKQPSNELTEEKTLGSWSMFEYFHNDTYNFLRHGANRLDGSWLDAATDLAETSFSTGGARTTFNIGNYYGGGGYSELSDTWESRYRAIRKCNRVINQMDLVPNDITKSPEQEAQDRATMMAEARIPRLFLLGDVPALRPCAYRDRGARPF